MKKVNELMTYAIVLRLADSSIRTVRVNADSNQESAKSGTKLFV
jgi:uncharacterized protein with GYD domain